MVDDWLRHETEDCDIPSISVGDLHARFVGLCQIRGMAPLSLRAFGELLNRAGVQKKAYRSRICVYRRWAKDQNRDAAA